MNQAEKDLIDQRFENVHQVIGSGFREVNESLKRIIEYNEYQNGRIARAVTRIGDHEEYITDLKKNPIIKQIKKRPVPLIIIGFILVLMIFGFITTDELLTIKKFW